MRTRLLGDFVMIVTAEEQRVMSSPVENSTKTHIDAVFRQCVIFASTFYLGQPGPTKVAQFLNYGRSQRHGGAAADWVQIMFVVRSTATLST